jgi:ABC-type transport system involved in cytochrome bd biosynthesis fused ATPase/permease subunit
MVKEADHVIVLSAGEVMEQGSPSELIAKGGWFARFAHAVNMDEPSEVKEEEEVDGEGEDAAE